MSLTVLPFPSFCDWRTMIFSISSFKSGAVSSSMSLCFWMKLLWSVIFVTLMTIKFTLLLCNYTAAFFKNATSFLSSSFSFFSLRISFMLSYSAFASVPVWHSSRNCLHHAEIAALDTPYSAVILL